MADVRITPAISSIQFTGSVEGDVLDLIYTGSALQFNTGSIQLLGIKPNGDVQIGSATNPNSVLSVTGSINVSGSILTTGSINVAGNIYTNGTNIQSLSIAYAIALG